VEGIIRVAERIPQPNPEWSDELLGPGTSSAPYRIYNIGNHDPVELKEFIAILEDKLGKKAQRNPLPMQQGDVPATFADVAELERDIGFKPKTSLREGIGRFVDWYLDYYESKEPVAVRARTRRRIDQSTKQVAVKTRAPAETDLLIGANR
jgi:UDP-glucuronate 4-epimerase